MEHVLEAERAGILGRLWDQGQVSERRVRGRSVLLGRRLGGAEVSGCGRGGSRLHGARGEFVHALGAEHLAKALGEVGGQVVGVIAGGAGAVRVLHGRVRDARSGCEDGACVGNVSGGCVEREEEVVLVSRDGGVKSQPAGQG